jgi:hypothetical protein
MRKGVSVYVLPSIPRDKKKGGSHTLLVIQQATFDIAHYHEVMGSFVNAPRGRILQPLLSLPMPSAIDFLPMQSHVLEVFSYNQKTQGFLVAQWDNL